MNQALADLCEMPTPEGFTPENLSYYNKPADAKSASVSSLPQGQAEETPIARKTLPVGKTKPQRLWSSPQERAEAYAALEEVKQARKAAIQ
jgi:hypothetical protein